MELDCLGCLAWKVSIFLIRKIHFLVSIFNNMFKVLLGTINIRGGREGGGFEGDPVFAIDRIRGALRLCQSSEGGTRFHQMLII